MKDESQKMVITALKKAAGTLSKLLVMTEEKRACLEISQQINATMGLLRSANSKVLECHLRCHAADDFSSSDKSVRERAIAELMTAFDRSSRK